MTYTIIHILPYLEKSTLGVKTHDCVVIKVAGQRQLVDLYRPLNTIFDRILYIV